MIIRFSLCPASFVHNHTKCAHTILRDSKFSVEERKILRSYLGPCIEIFVMYVIATWAAQANALCARFIFE